MERTVGERTAMEGDVVQCSKLFMEWQNNAPWLSVLCIVINGVDANPVGIGWCVN